MHDTIFMTKNQRSEFQNVKVQQFVVPTLKPKIRTGLTGKPANGLTMFL